MENRYIKDLNRQVEKMYPDTIKSVYCRSGSTFEKMITLVSILTSLTEQHFLAFIFGFLVNKDHGIIILNLRQDQFGYCSHIWPSNELNNDEIQFFHSLHQHLDYSEPVNAAFLTNVEDLARILLKNSRIREPLNQMLLLTRRLLEKE